MKLYLTIILAFFLPFTLAELEECCCNDGSGPCSDKDPGCCRRVLLFEDDETTINHHAMCEKEDYRVSLVVEGHISLLAEPQNTILGCETLEFDANVLPDGTHFKMMKLADVEDKDPKSMYDFGIFTYSDIVAAYQNANPEPVGREYDIVTNNCASFVIDMADGLGIKPTLSIVRFTAKRLTAEASDKIINAIHLSPNGEALIDPAAEKKHESSETIMEKLVSYYVQIHGGLF